MGRPSHPLCEPTLPWLALGTVPKAASPSGAQRADALRGCGGSEIGSIRGWKRLGSGSLHGKCSTPRGRLAKRLLTQGREWCSARRAAGASSGAGEDAPTGQS